jgi:hypothetical protein
MPSRRHFLAAAGASPLVPHDAAAATPPVLTFTTPAEHVRAFLKLHVSLAPETIYHLYTGTWEALLPGRAPVDLVSSTTVIRRQVDVRPKGHHISIWEATVYHRPGESEPLMSFVNPLNDRTVRPFHQREGRGQFLWAPDGPRVFRNGEWTSINRTGKPFAFDWAQAGERIWMSRRSSGVYLKNPLDPAVWKLEYAGPELLYSEKTTNSGLVREVADPAVMNASSTYSLDQVMVWWPWLLMGQQPGFLSWNTNGVKLTAADQIPAATRKLIEKIHPTIFAAGDPWEGHANLWTDYPKQRAPEKV